MFPTRVGLNRALMNEGEEADVEPAEEEGMEGGVDDSADTDAILDPESSSAYWDPGAASSYRLLSSTLDPGEHRPRVWATDPLLTGHDADLIAKQAAQASWSQGARSCGHEPPLLAWAWKRRSPQQMEAMAHGAREDSDGGGCGSADAPATWAVSNPAGLIEQSPAHRVDMRLRCTIVREGSVQRTTNPPRTMDCPFPKCWVCDNSEAPYQWPAACTGNSCAERGEPHHERFCPVHPGRPWSICGNPDIASVH